MTEGWGGDGVWDDDSDLGSDDPSGASAFRPFSEFKAEMETRLRAEQGWARYMCGRLRSRIFVHWRMRLHYWLHPEALGYVSPEAFAAITPEDIAETLAAIAMARDSAETACPAPVPKDCQARAESIAQPIARKEGHD
jgi:hypothetical protein